MKSSIGDRSLSIRADEMLLEVARKGGQTAASFDDEVIHEAMRHGYVEQTTIGVPDPILTLTQAGKKRVGLL